MIRFIKKPVEVEGVFWTGENLKEISEVLSDYSFQPEKVTNRLWIKTPTSGQAIAIGDLIVPDSLGGYRVIDKEVILTEYEPVATD